MTTRSLLSCLLALALSPAAAFTSRATPVVVTTVADAGPGSLREAVNFAGTNAGGAVITFDPALEGLPIILSIASGELVLSNQVTIDASAFTNGMTIIAGRSVTSTSGFRIMEVAANSSVELDNLTIAGGYALPPSSPAGEGGGILVDVGAIALTLNHCTLSHNYAYFHGGAVAALDGTVILNNCTITRNVAGPGDTATGLGKGGGLYAISGTVVINNSTLSDNVAVGQGGGLYGPSVTLNNSTLCNNYALGNGGGMSQVSPVNNSTLSGNSAPYGGGAYTQLLNFNLNNSTFSENTALISGGGLYKGVGSVSLTNTIMAGNTAPTNSDIFGIFSSDNSFTNGNPLLAPLGHYGGPTLTMPPLAGSPAIDAGDDSVTNFLTADQRGYPRLSGAHVDIGAVEVQVVSEANAPMLNRPVVQANGGFTFDFTSSPDTDFTVLAATNPAQPATQWSNLGPATQNPPGQYQFTDIFAPNYPKRFYRVKSP